MKNLFRILLVSLFVFSFASCEDDEATPPSNVMILRATLSGANEVPANSSTATGTAELRFNTVTKVYTITVNHTVNATAGHVHIGAAGTNGGVFSGFTSAVSPINATSPALTPAQEADLMAGRMYVNIHSAAFPGGEIRGQLNM